MYPFISPLMTRTAAGFPRTVLNPAVSSAEPASWPADPALAGDEEAGEELVEFDDVHPTYPRTAADKARAAQGRKSIRAIG
jgi:hypothetical protein